MMASTNTEAEQLEYLLYGYDVQINMTADYLGVERQDNLVDLLRSHPQTVMVESDWGCAAPSCPAESETIFFYHFNEETVAIVAAIWGSDDAVIEEHPLRSGMQMFSASLTESPLKYAEAAHETPSELNHIHYGKWTRKFGEDVIRLSRLTDEVSDRN